MLICFGLQQFGTEIFTVGQMADNNCSGGDKIRPELKHDSVPEN